MSTWNVAYTLIGLSGIVVLLIAKYKGKSDNDSDKLAYRAEMIVFGLILTLALIITLIYS